MSDQPKEPLIVGPKSAPAIVAHSQTLPPCPWCSAGANESCTPTCAATPSRATQAPHFSGTPQRGKPRIPIYDAVASDGRRPLLDDLDTKDALIANLAMTVRRLCYRAQTLGVRDKAIDQAADFLKRHGLQGSILRETNDE